MNGGCIFVQSCRNEREFPSSTAPRNREQRRLPSWLKSDGSTAEAMRPLTEIPYVVPFDYESCRFPAIVPVESVDTDGVDQCGITGGHS